jgi:hypothetical protein
MTPDAAVFLLHLGELRRFTTLCGLKLQHLALEAHALISDAFVLLFLLLELQDGCQ